jgi:ABC-type sugar transport system ATPase subunit
VGGLIKRYPKAKVGAVAGISFTAAAGEVIGLLGPNGAGKPTTIGVLTARVRATGGVARVAGVDVGNRPVEARRVLGVVPQRNNLDRSISVRQNLLFHAAYHGVPIRAAKAGAGAAGAVRPGGAGRGEAGGVGPGPRAQGGSARWRSCGARSRRASPASSTRRGYGRCPRTSTAAAWSSTPWPPR